MAHKRFITSGISTDERLAPVAAEDVQCALMWPWLLLEFDDWGRAEFSPVRTKLSRFPAFAALSPEDIERAINLFIKHGLMHKAVPAVRGADPAGDRRAGHPEGACREFCRPEADDSSSGSEAMEWCRVFGPDRADGYGEILCSRLGGEAFRGTVH